MIESLQTFDAEENIYLIFNARQALMSLSHQGSKAKPLHILDVGLLVGIETNRITNHLKEIFSSSEIQLNADDAMMIYTFTGR